MSRRRTRIEQRLDEELLSENLPVDFLPLSNGEHFPEEPDPELLAAHKLADEATEEARRRFGMSRRQFVRTSAAMWIGLWAINKVSSGKYGYYAMAEETGPNVSDDPLWDACTLNFPGAQLNNLPGEFVVDTQSHHVTNDTKWRVLQPVHHAFICGFFGANHYNPSEIQRTGRTGLPKANANFDPCQNTGRWQYIKDLLLDSSTTVCVLSAIPSAPDEQSPIPFAEMHETADMVQNLAGGTMRVVTQGYVMPNRGWFHQQNVGYVPAPLGGQPINRGTGVLTPGSDEACSTSGRPATDCYPFLKDELDWMEERAIRFRKFLRGWKVYTPYGDVPFSSGMRHDDPAGMAMNEKIIELWKNYGVPPVLASHKGVWLPTFDDRTQAVNDVPGAALAFPDIRFVIYHSAGGWKGNLYPTDAGGTDDPQADNAIPRDDFTKGVIGLLLNLHDHGLAATQNIPAGLAHGNTPNVSVDLGSVFPSGGVDQQALFIGTMVKHLGGRRICWGTDCLWTGSPQPRIAAMRTLQFTDDAPDGSPGSKRLFNLPWGLDGDRFDPRVNALTGEVTSFEAPFPPAVGNAYSQAYLDQVPALQDPAIGGNWPTSGTSHPERSIRNGILGRNAAEIYEIDTEELRKAVDCDDVQRLRDEYISNQVNGLASIGPSRSNEIFGPRTKQGTIAMLNEEWKKNGWS